MSFPKNVTIVEVSPRDGLQNEAVFVPTDIKISFINKLGAIPARASADLLRNIYYEAGDTLQLQHTG